MFLAVPQGFSMKSVVQVQVKRPSDVEYLFTSVVKRGGTIDPKRLPHEKMIIEPKDEKRKFNVGLGVEFCCVPIVIRKR